MSWSGDSDPRGLGVDWSGVEGRDEEGGEKRRRTRTTFSFGKIFHVSCHGPDQARELFVKNLPTFLFRFTFTTQNTKL